MFIDLKDYFQQRHNYTILKHFLQRVLHQDIHVHCTRTTQGVASSSELYLDVVKDVLPNLLKQTRVLLRFLGCREKKS